MKVIANPQAGHGHGSSAVEKVRRLLDDQGVAYDLSLTEAPGHATELARRAAASGTPRVIVVGGDGTISEVINGLVGTAVEIGLVSVGTGNDLARTLKLPYNDVVRAVAVAVSGRPRTIDVARDGERFFVSALACGFPSLVAEQSGRMKWLSGPVAYGVAAYRAMLRMRPFTARLELDGEVREMQCTSILVQNTAYTGGGLLVAPDARVDDGFLDVIIVGKIGRIALMVNFPRVYKGTHCSHPSFSAFRAKKVHLEAEGLALKTLDGDVFRYSPVDVNVISHGATILVNPAPRISVAGPQIEQ